MKRNKKIIIVAHCVLNVNSKIKGIATYGGSIKSIITSYLEKGFGIIQLPCPETTYLGLERWGMARNQYDSPGYRRHCRNLLLPIVEQIVMYTENDCAIDGILCIDGSPSCGLNLVTEGYFGGLATTANDQALNLNELKGKGIFIDELDKLLKENNLQIRFFAVSEKSVNEEVIL